MSPQFLFSFQCGPKYFFQRKKYDEAYFSRSIPDFQGKT